MHSTVKSGIKNGAEKIMQDCSDLRSDVQPINQIQLTKNRQFKQSKSWKFFTKNVLNILKRQKSFWTQKIRQIN